MTDTGLWEERYRIVPQMRVYDALEPVIRPYLTFVSAPGFRSDIVNTDDEGFRFSYWRETLIDSRSWNRHDGRKGLVLGGSFAFGVGATGDRTTPVSLLASLTGDPYLNLGIRAGNSTQELISAIPFLHDADVIVVLSGLNNLVVALQSTGRNELYGPLFVEEALASLGEMPVYTLARTVRGSLAEFPAKALAAELRRRIQRRIGGSRHATASTGGASRVPAVDPTRLAFDRQARDLSILARAVGRETRLVFVVQPFADERRRNEITEERRLFDLTDEIQPEHWQVLKATVAERWAGYRAELGTLCERLGVRFFDLNDQAFTGWTYVDRAHMTDHGYAQVAKALSEAI